MLWPRLGSASVVEPFEHGRRDRLLASGRGMLAVVLDEPGLAAVGLAEVEPVPSDGRDGVAQRPVQRSEVVVARLRP